MGVYFLRRYRDEVQRAWMSERRTPDDKSRALTVLGDAVILVRHPYERHPNSGAGNCWCGRSEGSSLHAVVIEPARAKASS